MDISGIGSSASSASAFTALGGTNLLPASTQAKIMIGNSNLSLIPAPSSFGLGGNLDIYSAVNMQSMGALSGLSAVEYSGIKLGIDMSKTDPTGLPTTPAASTPAPAAPAGTKTVDYSNSQFALGDTTGASGWFDDAGWVDPNAPAPAPADAGTSSASSSSASTATSPTAPTASTNALDPTAPTATNSALDQILKEDGYTAPDANNYSVQTDFFANQSQPVTDTSYNPYVNTTNSNPDVGTLLDSIG